jgi:uncharacterized protein YyaL (SSP411 family)
MRTKDYFDNAIPSGNSSAALAFLKLWALTQGGEYQRCAASILRTMREAMARYPNGFGYMLCALDLYLSEGREIAIIGDPSSHEVRSFVEAIYSRYLPNKVVASALPGDSHAAEVIKLLEARPMVAGKATAYVCRNYSCLLPATSVEELNERLNE